MNFRAPRMTARSALFVRRRTAPACGRNETDIGGSVRVLALTAASRPERGPPEKLNRTSAEENTLTRR